MKTPEDIKKGLEDCGVLDGDCENCPYDDGPQLLCVDRLRKDVLAYIQQLESRLAQVERERDAAVRIVHGLCLHCKNDDVEQREKCRECMYNPRRFLYSPEDKYIDNWEWCGVCEENTKEDSK